MKWLVGIDEVGRGPLAGPVMVGVVKVAVDFDWTLIPGVGDSKKVSEKKREAIFHRAKELKAQGLLDFAIGEADAMYIDEHGIAEALRFSMRQAIEILKLEPADCFIKLDGSLKAPTQFEQETIIKGDSKESTIGLASIVAKVTRDTYMNKIAERYPEYSLEVHKGYGTKIHREAIVRNGLSKIHRNSYCQNRSLWGKV